MSEYDLMFYFGLANRKVTEVSFKAIDYLESVHFLEK